MSLSRRLQEALGLTAAPNSKVAAAQAALGVVASADLKRVCAVPRRVLDPSTAPDLSPVWRIDDPRCAGCDLCRAPDGSAKVPRLRPIQSAMLLEAEAARGALDFVGVGHGKELVWLLLADAAGAQRAALFTEPALLERALESDAPRYGRHFRLPLDRVSFFSYSHFSVAQMRAIFEEEHERRPFDWVIFNEAHALRSRDSARGKFHRDWTRANPGVRCAYLTGTPGGVRDYALMAENALGPSSPLPHAWRELDDWSRALDEDREGGVAPMEPGELLLLCGPEVRDAEFETLPPADKVHVAFGDEQGEAAVRGVARRVYQRRLRETRGVVLSGNAGDADCSLVIRARRPRVPDVVRDRLAELRRTWCLDGEELNEAVRVAAAARQLACGFYYRWMWPGGEPDREWLDARAAWHRRVRHSIRYLKDLYSPLQVRRAALVGEIDAPELEGWLAVESRYRPAPPREAVWLSDFLVDDCVAWARARDDAREPGVIWYQHLEIGKRLRAAGIAGVYGGGPGEADIEMDQRIVIAASVSVHGKGKNLQGRCANLITTCPSDHSRLQQLLGRTHRAGQRAECVSVDAHAHDQSLVSALASALRGARRHEQLHGEAQKVAYAARIGFGAELDSVADEQWPTE